MICGQQCSNIFGHMDACFTDKECKWNVKLPDEHGNKAHFCKVCKEHAEVSVGWFGGRYVSCSKGCAGLQNSPLSRMTWTWGILPTGSELNKEMLHDMVEVKHFHVFKCQLYQGDQSKVCPHHDAQTNNCGVPGRKTEFKDF